MQDDTVPVALDHQPTQPPTANPQQAQNQQKSVVDDYYHNPMEEINKISLPFKIHLGLAICITTLCFFIWKWTSFDVNTSVWWWIFVLFFFAITITLHHNISSGTTIEGVVNAVIVLNFGLYATYVVAGDQYPWWIYPAIVSAMILVPIYYKKQSTESQYHDIFNVVWFEFWALNLMLFLTWVSAGRGHPWFLYPLIVLAAPMAFYRIKTKYQETRIFVLVGVPLVFFNLLMFVVWGFTNVAFPWFAVILAASVALEAFLIWKFKGQTHQPLRDELPTTQPSGQWVSSPAESYESVPTGSAAPAVVPTGGNVYYTQSGGVVYPTSGPAPAYPPSYPTYPTQQQ